VNLYLFDVDHTLEFAGGPVKLEQLARLKNQGHTIGICGNWAPFCLVVENWHQLVSVMNVGVPKDVFMRELKHWLARYDHFVMVGNDGDGVTISADRAAAEKAGWEFVLERDFKEGLA